MIFVLILFALIYILLLALPQQRPFVALGGNLRDIYDSHLRNVTVGVSCMGECGILIMAVSGHQ